MSAKKLKKAAKVIIAPLGKILKQGKFQLTQLKRIGDVALFKKDHVGNDYDKNTYKAGYEVVIITRHNGYSLAGTFIKPAEVYPCNSLWGTKGFTASEGQLSKAEQKFNQWTKAAAARI